MYVIDLPTQANSFIGCYGSKPFSCLKIFINVFPLTYTWTLNGKQLSDGLVDTSVPGQVLIDTQHSEDKGAQFLGIWKCTASNGISMDFRIAQLQRHNGISGLLL